MLKCKIFNLCIFCIVGSIHPSIHSPNCLSSVGVLLDFKIKFFSVLTMRQLFSYKYFTVCVSSRMGYDLERFVGYVNEGLLCCVCRDVLEDPLQAPCEHAFCSSCIHGWLIHHNSCPEDRLPLDITHLRPLFRYHRCISTCICT